MNSFTNTILTLLLGWLRSLLNAARDFVSSDASTAFFNFFRQNWRVLFLILCIIGFSLDIIVYLARWRPRLLRRRRRSRQSTEAKPVYEAYDDAYGTDDGAEAYQEYDADVPAASTHAYAPAFDYSQDAYAAEPTAQYQIQSRQNGQTLNVPPVTLPYATPQFAPEASAYQENAPILYTDEPAREQPYAPSADQQRFAFGMAPSFGSAQSEPAYHYHRDSAPTFAPPQYAQDYAPAESPQPLMPQGQPVNSGEAMQPQTYDRPSPYFRPFSDRGEPSFSPPRARGLGAVAKRARTLLNADEAYNAMSYKDLQSTVDVSKAFHSPVYPEKKPEGDS